MIRPWEKFNVVSHQIEIEYIDVVRRSYGVLIAEIGTRQKYPEVLTYSGWELNLVISERTPDSQRNESSAATSVLFPRSLRGWSIIVPNCGRYSLTLALYKPARHRNMNEMITQTEQWRIKEMLRN